MRTTTKFGWIVAALVITLRPGTAFAQNNTCDTAALMAVDDLKEFFLREGKPNVERWYRFYAVAGRSYCVEVVGDAVENNYWDSRLDLYQLSCTPLMLIDSNDDSYIDPPLLTGSRVCFVPSSSNFYNAKVYPTAGTAPANRFFDIRVSETTLFSPFYQVALSAGYDAAPQIKNNTTAAITVSFTTYNSSGAATGCVNTAMLIPANGMTTFGISWQCGMTSAFGAAQIAHNGPPGAITANITTFSAASGLSFDAAFAPRQKNIPVN